MATLTGILGLIGILICGLGWLVSKKMQARRILAGAFWVIGLLFVGSGSYSYWYHHRSLPEPIVQKRLFEGVMYTREVHTTPRPNVVHIITVDLTVPDIRFLVTPSTPIDDHQFPARTTSEFLQEFDVQLAINGGFYYPFHGKLTSYYPHVGDPVSVFGFAMSEGEQYSEHKSGYHTLYISRTNQVAIDEPLEQPYNALSGYWIFVKDGTVLENLGEAYYADKPGARTAVAIDQAGQHLFLFVVDGRQPNYSEGMTLSELGQIAIQYGADIALNLDNGGSSTLVMEDTAGNPIVLNSPIHRRIPPGRERPVANHLGLFVNP